MKTPRPISNAQYQSAPAIHTPKLSSNLEQTCQHGQGIYIMRGGVVGILKKLWKAIRIEIPIGYQDEAGFHLGVEPAEVEVKSCRHDSFLSRRRATCLNQVNRRGKASQSSTSSTNHKIQP